MATAGMNSPSERQQALNELKSLEFAFASLVQMVPKGSHERENAENAFLGVRARIDKLVGQFNKLTEEKIAADVARKLMEMMPSGILGSAEGASSNGINGPGPAQIAAQQNALKTLKISVAADRKLIQEQSKKLLGGFGLEP